MFGIVAVCMKGDGKADTNPEPIVSLTHQSNSQSDSGFFKTQQGIQFCVIG